jgi:DNA-binding response OmpR family regulator
VPLATREFDLLAFMAENEGLVLSRQQLLDNVWGHGWYGDERTVDVHVRWLREKLERRPGRPSLLETIRGVGYRLRAPDAPRTTSDAAPPRSAPAGPQGEPHP